MTTLIYSGTLYSQWQHLVETGGLTGSHAHPNCQDLTEFSAEICAGQFSATNEQLWNTFTPDDETLETARNLIGDTGKQTVSVWADTHCSLCLDFWRSVSDDARFVLFYSSPEHELGHYIHTHPQAADSINKVIDAWIIRTRSMLTFFLNNRDDCLLLDIQSARSQSGTVARLISEKFNLDFETDNGAEELPVEGSALLAYLATSLLLDNETVAEIYDEVRSAGTVICAQDKAIVAIQKRNQSLVKAVMDEYHSIRQLTRTNKDLKDELDLKHLQINQMMEELEIYFAQAREQETIANTFADYLAADPLLRVVRQARAAQ